MRPCTPSNDSSFSWTRRTGTRAAQGALGRGQPPPVRTYTRFAHSCDCPSLRPAQPPPGPTTSPEPARHLTISTRPTAADRPSTSCSRTTRPPGYSDPDHRRSAVTSAPSWSPPGFATSHPPSHRAPDSPAEQPAHGPPTHRSGPHLGTTGSTSSKNTRQSPSCRPQAGSRSLSGLSPYAPTTSKKTTGPCYP